MVVSQVVDNKEEEDELAIARPFNSLIYQTSERAREATEELVTHNIRTNVGREAEIWAASGC